MYIFFADLFEFAVLHLDGGMVLDLLPNIPVPSDRGILPREALTLLKQKIKIITNTPAVKVESSMKSEIIQNLMTCVTFNSLAFSSCAASS